MMGRFEERWIVWLRMPVCCRDSALIILGDRYFAKMAELAEVIKTLGHAGLRRYLTGEKTLAAGLKSPYVGPDGFNSEAYQKDIDVLAGKNADKQLFLELTIHNAQKGRHQYVADKAESAIMSGKVATNTVAPVAVASAARREVSGDGFTNKLAAMNKKMDPDSGAKHKGPGV